jgi:hypothetical protein
MKYRVIGRDPNSWTRTDQGDFNEITYDCNHHHRTLEGAIRCLRTLDGTTASIHARVETAAKDQKYDGERVEHDNSYYVAEQAVWASR